MFHILLLVTDELHTLIILFLVELLSMSIHAMIILFSPLSSSHYERILLINFLIMIIDLILYSLIFIPSFPSLTHLINSYFRRSNVLLFIECIVVDGLLAIPVPKYQHLIYPHLLYTQNFIRNALYNSLIHYMQYLKYY